MKKRTLFILTLCSSFTFISCKKNSPECDTATVCVKNGTANTIRYCWGCNSYTETLAPGEKACRQVAGPINSSSTVYVDFQTSSQTRRIEVSECNVEVVY